MSCKFRTSREITASIAQVFAAISTPERLALVGAGGVYEYVSCV